jgi:hypothetical protein
MVEGKTSVPAYNGFKMTADFILSFLLSWISIPFIIVLIYRASGKTPPSWCLKVTASIVAFVRAFIAGKKYT